MGRLRSRPSRHRRSIAKARRRRRSDANRRGAREWASDASSIVESWSVRRGFASRQSAAPRIDGRDARGFAKGEVNGEVARRSFGTGGRSERSKYRAKNRIVTPAPEVRRKPDFTRIAAERLQVLPRF
ncbi:hypothetical protein C0Z18_23390 [Trinickia dabaoshanensis]|uniref:Uncharacterized protein n=1 Tax=Trinickia dabaoshanensis TaxID=564714 RepID=A0A2N7VH92_9BURK|nr:hypothetical protein C0Z18_23390 [Trinickia dabaoshanensis]